MTDDDVKEIRGDVRLLSNIVLTIIVIALIVGAYIAISDSIERGKRDMRLLEQPGPAFCEEYDIPRERWAEYGCIQP